MSSEQRLRRLRELLERIEQLPASSESERMLREVRARIVDVDTGVTPRAMLPVDPDPTLATDPGPPAARAKAIAGSPAGHDGRRSDGRPAEQRRPVHAARPEAGSGSSDRITAVGSSFADDGDWLSLVGTDEVLSLDDSAPLGPAGEAGAGHDRRPWTRGLRG